MSRLVLCSHGTRSALGAARVTGLVDSVARALPSVEVREAHVDVHPPFFADVVTPGSVVVPLLLAPGFHVEHDIGRTAERMLATVTPAFGPDRLLTSLLVSRLPVLADDDVVVLAAAGSSVAGSDRSTREVAHQLAGRLGRPVHLGYGAASASLLDDLIPALRERHPGRRVVAASYLLAPGHFHDRVLASGADDVTEPLLAEGAPDRRLVELVVRRYLDGWLAAAV
jgi:sirohydrochlorin ferrochelatase